MVSSCGSHSYPNGSSSSGGPGINPTEASYALITTLDGSGRVEDFRVSGLSPDEARRLWEMPEGLRFFEYLSSLSGLLRVRDFAEHARSMGFPDFLPPAPVSSFIAAPIRHRGRAWATSTWLRASPGWSSAPRMRRPWSSPAPAGTGTSSAPGPVPGGVDRHLAGFSGYAHHCRGELLEGTFDCEAADFTEFALVLTSFE